MELAVLSYIAQLQQVIRIRSWFVKQQSVLDLRAQISGLSIVTCSSLGMSSHRMISWMSNPMEKMMKHTRR